MKRIFQILFIIMGLSVRFAFCNSIYVLDESTITSTMSVTYLGTGSAELTPIISGNKVTWSKVNLLSSGEYTPIRWYSGELNGNLYEMGCKSSDSSIDGPWMHWEVTQTDRKLWHDLILTDTSRLTFTDTAGGVAQSDSVEVLLPRTISCPTTGEPTVRINLTGKNNAYSDINLGNRYRETTFRISGLYNLVTSIQANFQPDIVSVQGRTGSDVTVDTNLQINTQNAESITVRWPRVKDVTYLQPTGDEWSEYINEQITMENNTLNRTQKIRIYGDKTGEEIISIPVELSIN